jgi:hypothetical protein
LTACSALLATDDAPAAALWTTSFTPASAQQAHAVSAMPASSGFAIRMVRLRNNKLP